MGEHFSKKANFKEIGKKANQENPNTFQESVINLTNDLLITGSKCDPTRDYKKIQFLGEGSYASVYLVKNHITDSIRAMKVIEKASNATEEDEMEIINEINILQIMDHPNILKMFEFYSSKKAYSIITEYCPGGELYRELTENGPFNEKYTAYVMFQIFSAINYCHKMNIIHRDLKPENILIVDRNKDNLPKVKICDFGTSKIVEKGTIQKRMIGSSYYMAPEVVKKNYNKKCDIWSCGVIMYILLSGRPPFEGDFDFDILDKVKKGKYDLKSYPFNKVSKSAIDLIKKLLIMDSNKRMSAEEALDHIWFKEQKSKELYNQIKDEKIMKKLVNNLKNYKRNAIIQETSLAYLVHNFPQMPDIINACKLFNQIDINDDGKISEEELLEGLSSKINSSTLKNDVHEIYQKLDMDNNGFIEYEEFVRAAVNKKKFMNDNVLRFAFRYFDKDNSGEITFYEIEKIFKNNISSNINVSDALKQIFDEVDVNRDGIITYKEFVIVMKKMLK